MWLRTAIVNHLENHKQEFRAYKAKLHGIFPLLKLSHYSYILRRKYLKMKTKNIVTLILLIAMTGALGFISYFGIGESSSLGISNIQQGLDLRGGISILYEADKDEPTRDEMLSALSLIRERLDRKNYTEAEVSILGTSRLRVDIPGVDNPEDAINEIGQTAQLRFEDESGNVLLWGTDVANASKQVYQENGINNVAVALEFSSDGRRLFEKATEDNIGKIIYIMLDEEPISAPVVNSKISDGNAIITGTFTPTEAEDLSALIRAGALPFNLNVISMNNVGARLGAESLETSLKAGIIGFILVLAFMLVIYKVFGLCANLALFTYIFLELIVLSLLGITLTLPGIAGIILSIGMATDANIIIFERIKEELKNGRTLKKALDMGFSRAFPAIIDCNITTLIVAAVLFWLGTGPVKGFAQTLSIGIVISMFTAIVITRLILKSLIGSALIDKKFYGVKQGENTNEYSPK